MIQDDSGCSSYPIDMEPLLSLPYGILDESGVPYNMPNGTYRYPAAYHPTTISQYALAHWNAYLATHDQKHREAFMVQARWLVIHESHLADDMGGWPIPFPCLDYHAPGPWLSALTQGNAISALVRAYSLTGEEVFLQTAHRAVRTFKLDIRNGGVSTSIANDGVFFEEVAAYPAAHILNGYIFSLFGLYDYAALTDDTHIHALIQRSLVTLHTLLDEYDTGYWSRYDLLQRELAPRFYHDQHSVLLEALAGYSNCQHCRALAARWRQYQHSFRCRVCYFIVSRFARYRRGIQSFGLRNAFLQIFKAQEQTTPGKVVPIGLNASHVAQLGQSEREIEKEHA
jgi:heparosan-N-sulfate-glucuronate 5-epimerase